MTEIVGEFLVGRADHEVFRKLGRFEIDVIIAEGLGYLGKETFLSDGQLWKTAG